MRQQEHARHPATAATQRMLVGGVQRSVRHQHRQRHRFEQRATGPTKRQLAQAAVAVAPHDERVRAQFRGAREDVFADLRRHLGLVVKDGIDAVAAAASALPRAGRCPNSRHAPCQPCTAAAGRRRVHAPIRVSVSKPRARCVLRPGSRRPLESPAPACRSPGLRIPQSPTGDDRSGGRCRTGRAPGGRPSAPRARTPASQRQR